MLTLASNVRSFLTSVRAALRFVLATSISLGLMQAAAAQQVFINELHYDNASTDVGESIEVAGPAGTDLSTWSIVLYNGSNGSVYNTTDLSGVIPNQGNAFGTAVVTYPSNGIQNGGPDGIALVNGSTVIQFLSYEGSFTASGGPADGATSTDIGVSESSGTAVGESLQLTGTGSSYSDFGWATAQASTFGAPNTDQFFVVGQPAVIINEVDADTAGIDTAEFIELYDGGIGNTTLDGLVLVLFNGSDDASYEAFDLDGQSTGSSGYFVLCVDAANTPNCDVDADGSDNLIQNGADAVALLVGEAVDFPEDTPVTTANLIDALVYDTSDSDDAGLLVLHNSGQPQVNENGMGNKDGQSNQRCPNGSGGARNTSTYEQFAPTAGAENVCVAPAAMLKIHEVQGGGAASPEVGNTVIIEGIVVGDFQGGAFGASGDLDGFFVQEEDADADADATTSEGIFVFDGSSPTLDVAVGDMVRVEGGVSEFNGLTEITSFSGVEILSSGNPLPTPASMTLPFASTDDLEAVEGMSITYPQALVISDYFNFDRFGEIILTSRRTLTPTAEFEPGPDAIAAADAFAFDQILLDDGRTGSNPDPARHPNGMEFNLDNLFRGGDTLQDVSGVMYFAFGAYRIQPTVGANYANDNPRTAEPEPVGGNLKVASLNVLNYFSTTDEGANRGTCGPDMAQGCRGADNAEEFTRQRDKIFAAILGIDADILGLVEIENHPTDAALLDLVSGLNAASGADTYAYVTSGVIGTDVIKVAMIYKAEAVSTLGDHAILDSTIDARFNDQFNRPALAQSFISNSTGGIVTVAVNHLKSKGADCNDLGDPDTGDGSGNCNLTRTSAAEALADWMAADPTDSGQDDYMIIGDLNAYDKEAPIDALVTAGNTDLIHAYRGEDAYSFLFGAAIGYLDHALSSPSLTGKVTGVAEWHINADEPDLINYDTSFKRDAQDAIYAPDAYRASDHDPVIVGLDVCDEVAPTFVEVSATPDVLWPPNHRYRRVKTTVVADDNFDDEPQISLLSVTSNEPDDAWGWGDGRTRNDIVVINDNEFKLRAERSWWGHGRVYTITYQVTDSCGNSAIESTTVRVPRNRRWWRRGRH